MASFLVPLPGRAVLGMGCVVTLCLYIKPSPIDSDGTHPQIQDCSCWERRKLWPVRVVLFSWSLGLPAGSVLGAVLLLWVMQLTHIPKPLHRASTADIAQKSQATFVLPNRQGLALDAVPLPVTVFN